MHSIIEHWEFIFFIDSEKHIYMINKNNNTLLSTYTNNANNFSMEVVEDNTIIVGTDTGFIMILDIQNNTLTQKYY